MSCLHADMLFILQYLMRSKCVMWLAQFREWAWLLSSTVDVHVQRINQPGVHVLAIGLSLQLRS